MKDIKLIKAETCSPESTVQEISKEMQKNKLRRLFVVDKDKKLLGIITTVDIINRVVAKSKDPSKIKASEVMEKNVLHVDIDEPLNNALKIMNKLKTFVCPIVEKKKLLGLVSYQNIISSTIKAARR